MSDLPMCRWRLELLPSGTYRCSSAKIIAPAGVPAELCRRCSLCDHEPPSVMVPKLPSLIAQARNWSADTTKWVAAGRPEVNDEEYERRKAICRGCDFRDALADICTRCGCPLHQTLLGDKLRRATSRCPLEPPKWKETV